MSTTFSYAITRTPGADFAQGITEADLGLPDYDLMLSQHKAYVEALRSAGLEVVVLDPLPGHPDAYFVEDTAIITRQVAVIANPGAEARRGEPAAIEPILARYRKTARIHPPGTMEGGDVLMVGDHFYIGISRRTNEAGAEQLGRILEGYGYTWSLVTVTAGLHLKTSVSYLGGNTLLVTDLVAGLEQFSSYKKILVEEGEERAANILLINDCLLVPDGFPKTLAKLEPLGYRTIKVDAMEARKMDGGLSCMSLRF